MLFIQKIILYKSKFIEMLKFIFADQGDCCPQAHSIGNGQCNPENINAQCLFDQGDCCNESLIGNNECDAVNNFTQCEFDGRDCTIVQFEKKDFIGSESCGFANVSIVRLFGSEKETSIKWKTNGYITDQSGNMIFNSGETQKSIIIDITDDNEYNPEETFEIELFELKGGTIGNIDKTKVTIEDNDGKKLYSNHT